MTDDNDKRHKSGGALKRWLSRHPRIREVLYTAGVVSSIVSLPLLGGLLGYELRPLIDDFKPPVSQTKEESDKTYGADQPNLQSMEEAVGKYVMENLVPDWAENSQKLEAAEQSRAQINVNSSLTHRVDKTAAETGEITVQVYDVNHPEDTPTKYDAGQLEGILIRAFSRLGIKVNVKYSGIDLGRLSQDELESAEQPMRNEKVEDAMYASGGTMVTITREGTKEIRYLGFKETLEGIVGKRNMVVARGPETPANVRPGNLVDAIVVLSNFIDSGTAGVSIHDPQNTANEAYVLVDKIHYENQQPIDEIVLALYIAHEIGHKLGIDHADFPLDVMSYAPAAFQLIKQYPELAFGPESVREWNAIAADYKAIAQFGDFSLEIKFPQGTACAGVDVPVAATAPLRETKLKVTLLKDNGGVTYSAEAKEDSKYVTVTFTPVEEGDYVLEAVVLKGDAAITKESAPLSVVDCSRNLERYVKDMTGGSIASLELGNGLAGVPVTYSLKPKGTEFWGSVTVLREGETKPVTSYRIYSSGENFDGSTFGSSLGKMEPGKYAIFVALQSGNEKPEILQKVFEVKGF